MRLRTAAITGLLVMSTVGCTVRNAGSAGYFQPESGDLLFQDSDCGAMCDAIEAVTIGYKGASFSHVGIAVTNESGEPAVIEAVSAGVIVTPLQKFLQRSVDSAGHPKVMVGRLKRPYRHLAPAAVREAMALKDRPYDKTFVIGNEAYYCSELVYEAHRRANGGNAFFALEPMTFKVRDGNDILPVWREYFAGLGVDVPQGHPGINPGGISRSSVLDIVYSYGKCTSGTKPHIRGPER